MVIFRDDFNEDEDDSAFLPADNSSHVLLAKEIPLHRRLLPGTSPASVQRRATVSGASPTVSKPPVNIEDLVNGVPRIKNSETFGRSISHDPARHKLTVKADCDIENSTSDKANKLVFTEKEASTKNEESISDVTEVSLDVAVPCSEAASNDDDDSSVIEVLPVKEEEYSLLENGGLNKVNESSNFQNGALSDNSKCDTTSYDYKNPEIQSAEYLSSCPKSSVSSISGLLS